MLADSISSQFQGGRLRKMEAVDVGQLCAMWLPFAQYETLETFALVFSWVCHSSCDWEQLC